VTTAGELNRYTTLHDPVIIFMIGEISAAFSVLKGGIELVQQVGDEKIDIYFSVDDILTSGSSTGGESVLAFVIITNSSSSPQSVTDIALDFGSAKAKRLPITGLKSQDTAKELLSVSSYTYTAHFERKPNEFRDFRILPDDIYLRQNESCSGAVLFELPSSGDIEEPKLELTVGTGTVLNRRLHP